jgi:hypothetical protein
MAVSSCGMREVVLWDTTHLASHGGSMFLGRRHWLRFGSRRQPEAMMRALRMALFNCLNRALPRPPRLV